PKGVAVGNSARCHRLVLAVNQWVQSLSALAAEIIDRLNNHPHATSISRAKLPEIPDLRYRLVELRDTHLGPGHYDWLSRSSAVDHRGLNKIDRRHRLRYFAKASNYNKLVFDIVSKD
ncbi:hypothetical protein, partial [Sedimentitalea nanhaiensis]|uniref:hypothetical protein n=1 Tax=Sedimentitalea nanhaiensis TaxID=999627 RepID=UPI001C31AD8B